MNQLTFQSFVCTQINIIIETFQSLINFAAARIFDKYDPIVSVRR